MRIKTLFSGLVTAVIFLITAYPVFAGDIHIAVASNFAAPMKIICSEFEKKSSHTVVIMFGSTGKHYTQIKNGAPIDLFFAADIERPRLLEQEKIAQEGTRFTYAIGKLVLWSPKENYIDPKGDILKQDSFAHLAMANPKLAPYGKAAEQVLVALGLWKNGIQEKLVRGENISQTFQYIKSGNAQLGFIAASQIKKPGVIDDGQQNSESTIYVKGSFWDIPKVMYSPIEQQAVLIKDTKAARAFLAFFDTENIKKIIRDYGYDTP